LPGFGDGGRASGAFDDQDFFPRVFGDHIEFIQIGLNHRLNVGNFIPQDGNKDQASQQGEDAEDRGNACGYSNGHFSC
jgi:hypothetical protein